MSALPRKFRLDDLSDLFDELAGFISVDTGNADVDTGGIG